MFLFMHKNEATIIGSRDLSRRIGWSLGAISPTPFNEDILMDGCPLAPYRFVRGSDEFESLTHDLLCSMRISSYINTNIIKQI